VRPDFDKLVLVSAPMVVDLRNPLEHLRNVSQIVDIVTFCGSREEFLTGFDGVVHLDGRRHDLLSKTHAGSAHLLAFVHKEPIHHVIENSLQRIGQERFHVQ
jgi:flagellar basal body P-ring protein FlgI